MTKRLTGFVASVAVILGCLSVSLNVGCNTEVNNETSTPDVTMDKEPPKDDSNAVAPPPPPPPGG